MLLTVDDLGLKVDVFVVDVLKVDVLEVVQMVFLLSTMPFGRI
jgi:hypothetical protein